MHVGHSEWPEEQLERSCNEHGREHLSQKSVEGLEEDEEDEAG
jgi:hypothetical protein